MFECVSGCKSKSPDMLLLWTKIMDMTESSMYSKMLAESTIKSKCWSIVVNDTCFSVVFQIRPYVNGTLYSILSLPEIREEAKAMVSKSSSGQSWVFWTLPFKIKSILTVIWRYHMTVWFSIWIAVEILGHCYLEGLSTKPMMKSVPLNAAWFNNEKNLIYLFDI